MIIGISGKAGSGKDTLADYIIDCAKQNHGVHVAKYSFAKPIKDAGAAMFGWDDRHAFGELKEVVDEELGFSPRKFYQLLGTEFGRSMLNKDLWMILARRFCTKNQHVVIPDVRFENEVDFVKSFFPAGRLIRVIRPNLNGVGIGNHASENGISEESYETYNSTFVNDASLRRVLDEANLIAKSCFEGKSK